MRKAFLLLAVLGLTSSLWAADPITGTWKLNLEKSKFSPNFTSIPKEQTETYRELSNGEIELTVKTTIKDGSSEITVFTYPVQGGLVKVAQGNTHQTFWVETRIGLDEWYVTGILDGKQDVIRHKKVSKDGKTLNQTIRSTDDQGKPFELLLVLDKQ